jgi:hypothetical protein
VPEVGEGLSEVGDEVVLSGGLDDHVVDVCFDVLDGFSGWPSGRLLQRS